MSPSALLSQIGLSGTLLILLFLVSSISGIVQGFAGFGFGIIAMAILPMLVELRYATIWVLVVSFLVCAAGVRLCWKDFQWRNARWLILGGLLGAPLGVILLTNVAPQMLMRLLGLMLISLPVSEFFNGKIRLRIPPAAAFPFGLLGGVLGGAFNMSGPPLVIFSYSQPWSRREIAAVLQVGFVSSMVVRLAFSAGAGVLTPAVCISAILSVPAGFLGLLLGRQLAAEWVTSHARGIIHGFMLLMGLKYLCFP